MSPSASPRCLGEQFQDLLLDVDEQVDRFAGIPFPVSLTLGVPVLLAKPLVLDFKRLRIGFVAGQPRADLMRVPTEFVKGLPLVPCRLGNRDVRAIFDTGAGFSILNASPREEFSPAAERVYSLEVTDSTGQTAHVDVFLHPQLSVGDMSLGEWEFLAIDLSGVEEGLGTRVDAVLGANTMVRSGCVWVIDRGEACIKVATRGTEAI